jgi:hypothetical protein
MLSVIIVLNLAGCSNASNDKKQALETYKASIPVIMKKDPSLNENIQYIAVELKDSKILSQSEKQRLSDYLFNKYHTKVIFSSLGSLKQSSKKDELQGLLLQLGTVKSKMFNSVYIEGKKYRSPKGSITVGVPLHNTKGTWTVKKAEEISKS